MDIRKGDMVHVAGGVGEVQMVVANNEGGYDLVVRVAPSYDELSRNVLRAGGPDEREDDKDVRPEDVHLEREAEEAERKADEEEAAAAEADKDEDE